MKKSNYLIYLFLNLLFILSSCTNQENLNEKKNLYSYHIESYVYENGTGKKKFNDESITNTITTEILSTEPLDPNMTEEIFSQLLTDLKPDIKVKTLLNDEEIFIIDIVDGISMAIQNTEASYPNSGICRSCTHDSSGNISDSMECSQQGIKHCAYATYQTWSTPKIIALSITGGAQAVIADCVNRNCFGW